MQTHPIHVTDGRERVLEVRDALFVFPDVLEVFVTGRSDVLVVLCLGHPRCGIPAGAKVPAPHSHDGFEETIYGLEGELTFTIDGLDHVIGAGDSACIQRGQVHGFDNRASTHAEFLAIATPGVFGPAYFHEMGELLAASAGGQPDLVALAEVMRRHGLTPAQPVPAMS